MHMGILTNIFSGNVRCRLGPWAFLEKMMKNTHVAYVPDYTLRSRHLWNEQEIYLSRVISIKMNEVKKLLH